MKRNVLFAALTSVGLLVAAASASVSAGTDASDGASGTLIVALGEDPERLDPNFSRDVWAETVNQALFDPLIFQDSAGNYVPSLATEWSFPDDLTIAFTLREGVTFHNGEVFDADAVKFAVERIQDRHVAEGSHMIAQFASIESVEVVDDHHVIFHLSRPDANLLLSLTRLMMVPPAYTAEHGTAGLEQHPIGTGPFTFVSYSADETTVLAANPDYWDDSPKGRALVEQVTFQIIPELTTRVAALAAGDVDIAAGLSIDSRIAVTDAGLDVVSYPDGRSISVLINTNMHGPTAAAASGAVLEGFEALTDVRVRQALNYAIDRQAIVDALMAGEATPLGQPFSPGGFGYDPDNEPYPYDPELAKQLLAEAGYPDGFYVKFVANNQAPSDEVTAIAAYLTEIGLDVEVEIVDPGVANERLLAGEPGMLRYQVWNNPHTFLGLLIKPEGSPYSAYSNPEVIALIDVQAAEMDVDARAEVLSQITDLMREDPASIYLWGSLSTTAWNGDRVQNFQPYSRGYVAVFNVAVVS